MFCNVRQVGAESHAVFDKHKALLSVFGEPRFIGEVGKPSTLKLALNNIVASQTATLAFALGYLDRSGLSNQFGTFMVYHCGVLCSNLLYSLLTVVVTVDLHQDILGKTMVNSPYFAFKMPAMQSRNYLPANFTTDLMLKDLNLMVDDAEKLGLNASSVKGVQALTKAACDAGFAQHDFAAMYEAVVQKKDDKKAQ